MARKPAGEVVENESVEELLAGKRPKKVTLARLEELIRIWPDHAGTKIYCYRLNNPKIDLSLVPGNKGTNIAMMQAPYPVDLRQWFVDNHGGGVFEIKFNDTNQPHAQIVVCLVEIPWSEAEPIVDVRTIVRGPVESEQLITKWLNEGKITKDQAGNLKPGAGSAAAGPAAPGDNTPQSVIELMTHTYKKSFDMAIQQNDPMKMLALLKEIQGDKPAGPDLMQLVTLIKTLQPQGSDPMMMELLREMREDRKLLMDRLLTAPEKPGGLSQMKELMEFVGVMREEFGVATPAAAKAPGFLESLAKYAPAFAPIVAPAVMRLLTPAGMTDAPAIAATAANPAQPAAPPSPAVTNAAAEGNRRLAALILQCLERELDGADLATTINLQYGEEAYDALKETGKEGMIAGIQANAPEFWERLAPRAADLDKLLTEFMAAYEDPQAPHV